MGEKELRDHLTDSEKLNVANIKAQASPVKGEGTMKKTQRSIRLLILCFLLFVSFLQLLYV